MKILKLLQRWLNMLTGKSAFHVKQGEGKYYSKTEIKGYYNDLTNKVSESIILDKDGIPRNITIANVETYFPITIFQYALGLYDLYIENNDEKNLSKFINIADWAIKNIDDEGMWDCMETLKDKAHQTQSAMCQSEGASVLLRAYVETNNEKYYLNAKKAIDFMLKDIKDGGTTLYENENIIFQEYVSKYNLSVLNGWIFSIFGLYDFTLINKDEKYKNILNKSIKTMSIMLKKYDRRIWSNYDARGTIASPAYHDLHIMQLRLLYKLFNINEFKIYANKWEKCQKSKIKKTMAILIKLKQKIFKNNYYDINTSLVK
ncbi:MAG: D-glucuronyl C5-epimerase family protein [Clostridia bacterium]